MNLKALMSGIAVVIDDEFGKPEKMSKDRIFGIVDNIEDEWEIPFYRTHEIPPDGFSDGLLRSASFVLLDWKLWRSDSSQLEKDGIEKNIAFLQKAKAYFIPVFIFTNEAPSYVANELPEDLYDAQKSESSFIFIKSKSELAQKGKLFDSIGEWIERNASVYALKAWEMEFYESKRALFSSMYAKSPDWPRVFWKSYRDDGADPGSSLANLINDNLSGRFRTDIFKKHILGAGFSSARMEDLRSLIQEASFVGKDYLPDDEIRSGDLFKIPKGKYLINIGLDYHLNNLNESDDDDEEKYLINIRPDCDCIPRENVETADDVELYCLVGEKLSENKLSESYNNGHFQERIWESISFSLYEGKTVQFDLRKLEKIKFSKIKDKRVGRLIHPYITRIKQRYASYMQREGLPRIPKEAICE